MSGFFFSPAASLLRGSRASANASSTTCPSVHFLSRLTFFASSSNGSEMEIVVLTHHSIGIQHHDVKQFPTGSNNPWTVTVDCVDCDRYLQITPFRYRQREPLTNDQSGDRSVAFRLRPSLRQPETGSVAPRS